jgi:4,5-DOPA dioxygenase extradiol
MKLPVIFFGHGNPMYAIQPNSFTSSWESLAKRLPRPKAILVISAHWLTRGTWLTAMAQPPTIHDFSGFPQDLFNQQYPVPGSPQLAQQVKDLLAPVEVTLEENEWGLDHGTWTVLKYLYPLADIPVIQMSLDASLRASQHYDLAKKLSCLRDQEVLIIGSGNVVHNLRKIDFSSSTTFPWAERFNEFFKDNLLSGNHEALIHPINNMQQQDVQMSNPSWEHYWPALYVLALQDKDDAVEIFTDGIDLASISMLSFKLG